MRVLSVRVPGRACLLHWLILFGKDAQALISNHDRSRIVSLRARTTFAAQLGCARSAAVLVWLFAVVGSFTAARAEINPPLVSPDYPISIQAATGSRWHEGEYEVWSLDGGCVIRQGGVIGRSRSAVVWINRVEPKSTLPSKVIAYMEQDVAVDFDAAVPRAIEANQPPARIRGMTWMGHFHSLSNVNVRVGTDTPGAGDRPKFVDRAEDAWQADIDRRVQRAQFVPEFRPAAPALEAAPTARSLQITTRSSVPGQVKSFPGRNPGESAYAVTGGVKAIVSGIQGVDQLQSDTVVLEADRVVVWTNSLEGLNFGGESSQPVDGRYEFYLEGNIIVREGDRLIYADRMYYNVNDNRGTILHAEMLTPVKDYEGLMRLKADVLQQIDKQNFVAHGAAVTSSRLGVPRYWLQAKEVTLQDIQGPAVDPVTGQPYLDPRTEQLGVEHQMLATARNNFLYIGGLPILYWPVIATDLKKPTYYLDRARAKNDSVYGTQVLLDWDMYQLLGIRQPIEGTKWTITTDYLSERGPAFGTGFDYDLDSFWFVPGETHGTLDVWGLKDNGRDNLGADRRGLIPEKEFRGRALWQHRQYLHQDIQFTAELGYVSDRNFLEQYYEWEWDQHKDQSTGIELKRFVNNSSWSISSDVRLNDFHTQTEWLPRLDHTLIGQSFLFDRMTWNAHSHVGYAKLQTAAPPDPINPMEGLKFFPRAWELMPAEGLHAATRQEVSLPMNLGPAKVVPYALGELFKIDEDIAGQDVTRAYGQLGARASLPFWRADPTVHSDLFNLNGLAHKVVFDADFLWADANRDLDRYPLYEPLDDDAVEFFRRRSMATMFASPFDERNFAFRSGMQGWVTAPSTAIADDLMKLKLGVRQRWQTKRGLPGKERIVDWIVFDVEGSFFPDATRDNFGEDVGMLDYDFRWHVGDRVTLLSDGYFDTFADGLRTFSVGGVATRPAKGSLFLGFRSIEGPISSNIVTGALSYRMSEKWVATTGASVDFGEAGNIGQTFALTRIGESTLIRVGINVDESRGNVGGSFMIEPRFLASSRLGYIGGVQIPPAGAYGLE